MLKKITLLSAILPVATALTEPCFGPGAYSVVGESGPCPAGEACPALQQQAFDDLKTKAYRANRAGRLMP
ncbi:MAG: hypothetical protein IPN66_05285 [Candidatus Competibacteraceae bacterium]|nr:hypothetical protein [Candidatus Competibacteraceae bacterium]MBK8896633.1 hypothetical protein [Candidatus Competibacteraceae bacterium]